MIHNAEDLIAEVSNNVGDGAEKVVVSFSFTPGDMFPRLDDQAQLVTFNLDITGVETDGETVFINAAFER